MNATTKGVPAPFLGRLVHYHELDHPPRAALVGHVYPDGRTVDLVVLMDGDARSPETRAAWAMGSGVTRARTAIVHRDDDPAGMRHWIEAESA